MSRYGWELGQWSSRNAQLGATGDEIDPVTGLPVVHLALTYDEPPPKVNVAGIPLVIALGAALYFLADRIGGRI